MATVSQVTEAVYRSRFDDQMTAGANAAAAAMDKLATAVEATEERVTRSERSATSWVRANDAVTQAATRAQKAKTDLANAEKALANDMAAGGEKAEAAGRALDALRAKAEQAEAKSRALSASFAAAGSAASASNAHMATFASANDNAANRADRLRGVLGQAGFQVQDFATQVAMGGNALQAAGVQGAQLLGMFGPTGAIAGAVLMVGTLAAQFLTAGSNADVAKTKGQEALDAMAKSGKETAAVLRDINALFLTAGQRAAALANAQQSELQTRTQSRLAELSAGRQELGRRIAEEQQYLTDINLPNGPYYRAESNADRNREAEAILRLRELRSQVQSADREIDQLQQSLRRLDNAGQVGVEQFGPDAPAGLPGSIDELRRQVDQRTTILEQFQQRKNLIDVNLSRGDIGQAEASRLVGMAEKERDDGLRRLTETSGRMTVAQREANKELQFQLQLENEIYDTARRTASGLDSYNRGDDLAIRFAQANIKRAGLDPDDIEKAAKEAQRASDAAYKDQQRKAEATYDRIADYAGNAFADMFLNTEGGWKQTMANLERMAIATFAKIAFEAAARPIIMPVVQAFTGTSAVGTAASVAGQASGATSATTLAGGGTSLIGYGRQVSGLFDSSFFGGSQNFQSGFIGTADRYLNTNVAGFLDRPLYTVGGEAIPLGADPIAASYAQPGVDVSIGQAAGGALGVAGGLYGIYSGIQTGGAKGWAQGASGAAATAGGAAILAGGSAAGGVIAATAAWAPYIAAIAALVAMFLPGQKPSDKTGTALLNTATGDMLAGGLSGDRYSQENRDAAASMADTVKQFASQMSSSYGITPYGQYIVGVGARDGMFWQTSERHEYGSDEASAQQMMRDITRDLLEQNAWQLQGNLRTTYNTVGTGDIDKLLQALDWTNTTYKAFQENADPEKPTQFAQSLKQITDAYGPLIAKAQEYGLALEPIADAQQEQINKLIDARSLQFNQMIAGYNLTAAQLRGDTGTTLALQLQQFDLQRASDSTALVDQVKDLGLGQEQIAIALSAFNEVKDLQRQAVIDQSAAAKAQQEAAAAQEESTRLGYERNALQTLASQSGVLTSFLDQLATNDNASPQNAFLAAQEQFGRALAAARGGQADTADLSGLTGAAGTLLNATSSFYGDGAQAAAIRSGVVSQLTSVGADLGLPGFSDRWDATADRLIAAQSDVALQNQNLAAEMAALREEFRSWRIRQAA
jgi:hypothetical protein